MTVEIELGANLPEEDRMVLTEKDITNHNPIRNHTGKSDLTTTVKGNRDLEQFAQRQDRINVSYENGTEWTGYLIGVSHDTNGGTTRLRADGVEKRLEETRPDYDEIGGPVTYSNIALHDALKDYWPRTPFQNVDVTEQETELVAEDEQVQDADTTTEWENRVSIGDTEPFYIENGELRLAQSNFLMNVGDDSDLVDFGGGIGSPDDNEDFSGGVGRIFDEGGDFVELSPGSPPWELEHTIPEEYVEIGMIFTAETDSPSLQLTINQDGSSVGSMEVWQGNSGTGKFWRTTDGQGGFAELPEGWADGDLEPGSYTLEIEVSGQNGGQAFLDCVCVYDGRFSYNFDDTVDEPNGYYDGPELYPDEATIELDPSIVTYNATSADLTSVWDDTSGPQQWRVSNNGGSDWESASNTETLNTSFDSAGRELVVEATFGRYGSQTDATPLQGQLGQSIDSYNLAIDGNDLVVIVDMELTRNHFDNLDQLCGFGDFLYVVEHDSGPIEDLVVSCFRRGEETRDAPYAFQNPKNQQPEIQSGTYYNSIYLEGELQDDGTRPSAEVKDQEAIDRDRDEISPGVLRDTDISTEAGAQFRARALLETAQSNNDLVGSVTTPPLMTHPGYARPITLSEEEGEQYKTVEEVSLTLGNNSAEATSDFSVRSGFSEDIVSLKRSSRELGNQV